MHVSTEESETDKKTGKKDRTKDVTCDNSHERITSMTFDVCDAT